MYMLFDFFMVRIKYLNSQVKKEDLEELESQGGDDFKVFSKFATITSICCNMLGDHCGSIKKIKRSHSKMTPPRQEEDAIQSQWQKVTQGVGGGYMKIVASPPKKIMYKFLFFACFLSAQQYQLSFGQHSGGGVVSSTGLSPRAQTKQLHQNLVLKSSGQFSNPY